MTARRFTLQEFYPILFNASRSIPLIKSWKKTRRISKPFRQRIFLAISGVNGCSMCSFVHTKIALQEGMQVDEIKEVLQGEYNNIPKEEVIGVLFAQDYAASKEQIDPKSWDRLVKEYGEQKAQCVLHVARIITFTTTIGITLDSIKDRFRLRRGHNNIVA
jgi:AhpD family alkylhydroperoxidase